MDDRHRVTPYLLRRAENVCPRRLAREHARLEGSTVKYPRARLRDAFLGAARIAHTTGGPPAPEAFLPEAGLEPEERAVFDQAARWYLFLFGTLPFAIVDGAYDEPTWSPRRAVELGGWIDLVGTGDRAQPELRQLDLWGGRAPGDDPLGSFAIVCALLRVSRWVGDRPITVRWADLVRGIVAERTVELRDELPELAARFDDRLRVLRERADLDRAEPGDDCRDCRHVAGCPAHPGGAHGTSARESLVPGIVALTPTTLDTWLHCPRRYRNRTLLSLPGSDQHPGADRGLLIHKLLETLHAAGDAEDPDHVERVLARHGIQGPGELRAVIERHLRHRPRGAALVGTELSWARFHARPFPLFMATARLDAVWEHDGILDVRDYKTGMPTVDRVADDARARLQAWVAAPLAAQRGIRLQLRYEHLAPEAIDDPEVYEPDDADLAAIDEELHGVAIAIRSADAGGGFGGAPDAWMCATCEYRSICPQSAAPAEPSWPVPPS